MSTIVLGKKVDFTWKCVEGRDVSLYQTLSNPMTGREFVAFPEEEGGRSLSNKKGSWKGSWEE